MDNKYSFYKEVNKQLLQLVSKTVKVQSIDLVLGYGGHCRAVERTVRGRLVNYRFDEEYGLVVVLDTKEGIYEIAEVTSITKCFSFSKVNTTKLLTI